MAANIYTGFFLFSLLLIYFAYRQYLNTADLLLVGKKTKATVIEMVRSSSDDGYTYAPIFEYVDRGETKTFKSKVSSSPPAYQVGEKVQVVFDRTDDEIKVMSFWGLYRWTVILLMFASPIFVLTGAYLLYTRTWI